MRVYSAHICRGGLDPDRDIVLLKEGFCWSAALFAPLWALWHGLWLSAIVWAAVVGVPAVLAKSLNIETSVIGWLMMGVGVIAGFVGNDLRRADLARRGFAFEDVVSASSRVEAEHRFFEHHPVLAAEIADLAGVKVT